ncbi:MAG: N-acetyltransferase [Chloroflexi bacterium]|nr:N-acetyltransferase [Chloroflexota bacterium]
MTIVRPETTVDHIAIHRINEAAFGRPNEADLVDTLRAAGHAVLSLVAINKGQVVGHIFFTPVSIESQSSPHSALALGPMGVLPELQNRRIGSLLVRRGLEGCLASGFPVVVVLGHPHFYPRFGFTEARARGINPQWDVPDEAFMVAELEPGALRGVTGTVRYRPEFDEL